MVLTRSVSRARWLASSLKKFALLRSSPVSAMTWATERSPVRCSATFVGLLDHVAGQHAAVELAEFLAVVGEQALGHQLQQHVVVALEGDVDVQVRAQRGEAVLGDETGAAAGLAGFLQGVQGVPGAQRLQCRGEGLQVLAVLVGVGGPGEHAVELFQQFLVGEGRGVGAWPGGGSAGAGGAGSP